MDTPRTVEPHVQFSKEHGFKIKYTIDTYLHADQISGGRKLDEQVDSTYLLPREDVTEATFSIEPLEEGHDLTVSKVVVKIRPLYSPGHTTGTSLILDDKYLLSSDILFVRSIGRPGLAARLRFSCRPKAFRRFILRNFNLVFR